MPENTNFDDLDLDFSVEQTDNLFEEFHKGKKEGKKVVDIKTDPLGLENNQDDLEKLAAEKALKLKEEKALKDKLEIDELVDNFVGNTLNDINKDKSDKSDKKDEKTESVFDILYKQNVERGIWKEMENFDGTEEAYFEAQRLNDEDRIQQGLGSIVAEMFEDNPDKSNAELALDFLRHLSIGGNPKDYIGIISKTEISEEDLKSEDPLVKENAQRKVYFDYWAEQGLTESVITKKYNNAKLKEMLDDEVDTIYPLLKTKRDAEKKELVAKTTSQKIKSESEIQSFNQSLMKGIEESKDVYGIPLAENKKERTELLNYMFKNSVKSKNSEKLTTQFLADREELSKDPNWVIFQAMAARQIKTTGKLDLKILEKEIEQKKVNSLNDRLTAIMQGNKKEVKNSNDGEDDFSDVPDIDFDNLR
jgi:hypothetical protein